MTYSSKFHFIYKIKGDTKGHRYSEITEYNEPDEINRYNFIEHITYLLNVNQTY